MEQSENERIQGQVEAEANQRFPRAVQAVVVLEHSDRWDMKTGQLIIRVLISPAGPDGQEQTLRAFWPAHRAEMQQFRSDLSQRFPQIRLIQFAMTERKDPKDPKMITMPIHHHFEAGPGRPLTTDRRSDGMNDQA